MTADIRLNPSTKVARVCACRGWLIATPESAGVEEVVEQHQQTVTHRSWDRDAWIEANTTTQPVRTLLRRVDKVA